MTDYLSLIQQSLYPQWQYTGGYITVSEGEGSKIVLKGYAEPNWEEAQILIKKVESIAGVKPYWQLIGASEPPILLSEVPDFPLEPAAIEETKKEAKQTIEGLVTFVATIQSGINNKASQDIKAMFSLFDSTRKATEITLQNFINSSQDRDKQAREWLTQAISENFNQQSSNLQKTLSSFSEIWKDRMVDSIKSIDFLKAKDVVKRMQQQFPNESPWQISNRLINEKAIYATIAGAVSSSVPGLAVGIAVGIDIVVITPLLQELIYQVSVAYGFDKPVEDQTYGEILTISLLVNGSNFWAKKGLDFMTNHIPVYGMVAGAGTTLIFFYATGYAACEFYKAKSTRIDDSLSFTDILNSVEQKMEVYTQKLIAEEAILVENATKAIAMKEQLVPA
ncbi:hypothetical protein [Laspinema olomoucense]|uniref:hypothetical protein n=1 Tax=Laspinema olomoucense TaxID=3231600 RepID=UPI0021BA4E1B|nr:hypothetical protein [Laspinema sp. D3a]MCT7991828.1 hypothetical protein [Laspinema sp. D3a]